MSQWDANDISFCRGFEQSTESKEETEETEDVKVYIDHYFNMQRNHAVMSQWDANDPNFCRDYPQQDEVGELDTSVEEWKAALEVKDDPGETITELMERLGIKRTRLRTMINKLVKEGKAKRGYASRTNSYTGKSYQCAVYQLLKEEEK